MRPQQIPTALTIAGSDSGGGAGVQADLKTFHGLNVHGTSVITCVTAQNPTAVTAIQGCRPGIIQAQLDAVFAELPPRAAKTGMLFTDATIRLVAKYFRARREFPLVVDPVMVASSGAILLAAAAVRSLCNDLLPVATIITPNLAEAEVLLGRKILSPEDLRTAARDLYSRFGCAVLVKGGHLQETASAIDIFYSGRSELMLSAPRRRHIRTHGTGCTYSAAIVAYLARGFQLEEAVKFAKQYITTAIHQSRRTGKHDLLNHQA